MTDREETTTTPSAENRVLTLPNAISAARLCCVPVFGYLVLSGRSTAAFVVLLLAGASDWLDGWLARRFQVVTKLGQSLDPLADRLYVLVALGTLGAVGALPWWLVAVVVARDLLLLGNLLVLRARAVAPLPVHVVGKAATFALLAGLPLVLLAEEPALRPVVAPVAWALLLWGVGLYWWAAVGYLVQTVKVLRDGAGFAAPVAAGLARGAAGGHA